MTDLSQRLLADHGGLRGLLRLDVVELARIWGLDDASIRSLLPASASTPLHQAQVRTASITFHDVDVERTVMSKNPAPSRSDRYSSAVRSWPPKLTRIGTSNSLTASKTSPGGAFGRGYAAG